LGDIGCTAQLLALRGGENGGGGAVGAQRASGVRVAARRRSLRRARSGAAGHGQALVFEL